MEIHVYFRLSNLFHGLEDKSPLKADVYLSMLRLAKDADLANMVVTDLEQVGDLLSEAQYHKYVLIHVHLY